MTVQIINKDVIDRIGADILTMLEDNESVINDAYLEAESTKMSLGIKVKLELKGGNDISVKTVLKFKGKEYSDDTVSTVPLGNSE